MLLRHAIGHVLRRLRLERGLTLRRLADESRVSLPYLSEIERGRKEASSEIVAVLCRVLDVTAGELLTESAAVLAAEDDSRLARPGVTVLHLDGRAALERAAAGDPAETRTALLLAA
ncbi:helix-turn-helix domain-containing protein [Herbiconiux sp. CPCC 205716]|uniref:Helix-turn-helix domain-containing protein n=1 Tax=Herbiconiux gentiana TaxID=2970912 RepID=A0ABT2GMH3_9MICO|nr:helix-turn-helix domain-containing protein [Herbiconiux gentiana]MCS5715951.1 helix-turn-helix domain-containing protein [Herbiconiux gentiana]